MFCLLSTCFHSHYSVILFQASILQCIKNTWKFVLETCKGNSGAFSSKVKNRLLYTLNNWLDQMDKACFYVESTDFELSSPTNIEDILQILSNIPNHDHPSVYYQRTMVTMTFIKKVMFAFRFELSLEKKIPGRWPLKSEDYVGHWLFRRRNSENVFRLRLNCGTNACLSEVKELLK